MINYLSVSLLVLDVHLRYTFSNGVDDSLRGHYKFVCSPETKKER